MRSNVTNGLHYIDENVLLYPAGHALVMYATDTRLQEFIHGVKESLAITAVALSSSKRCVLGFPLGKTRYHPFPALGWCCRRPCDSDVHEAPCQHQIYFRVHCACAAFASRLVAVAERNADFARVQLYNLRNPLHNIKVLALPEMVSKEFVSMCFSADDKMLLVQGGAPDWLLSCWLCEKGKVRTGTCQSHAPPRSHTHNAFDALPFTRAHICVLIPPHLHPTVGTCTRRYRCSAAAALFCTPFEVGHSFDHVAAC